LAELGYRLRRMDWGQGLASEGALALVNWGFSSGEYDKIVATTMAVNHGSRRVMEKIGMNYARTVAFDGPDPIPGSEHGEVWYELMRRNGTAAPCHRLDDAKGTRTPHSAISGGTPCAIRSVFS
jgi:RimJ/RimL family protein N-acetyltransferase